VSCFKEGKWTTKPVTLIGNPPYTENGYLTNSSLELQHYTILLWAYVKYFRDWPEEKCVTLKLKAARYSETLVSYLNTTWR